MNIKIIVAYMTKSPISHIGETASTGGYFQTVKTSEGDVPVITGNSIRGSVRNYAAADLLDHLGVKVDKEVFHELFSGGNLSDSMKLDIAKAVAVREKLPCVSLLGGALGDMIMAGKASFGFVYPVCAETIDITGIASERSWHEFIGEIEFTRMDDSKNDKNAKYIVDVDAAVSSVASTQMRYSVQYIAVGVQLIQEIRLVDVNAAEYGAFLTAWNAFLRDGVLGGMSAKGFGKFEAVTETIGNEIGDVAAIEAYYSTINEKTAEYLPLLKAAAKEKKSGKGKDKSAGSAVDAE